MRRVLILTRSSSASTETSFRNDSAVPLKLNTESCTGFYSSVSGRSVQLYSEWAWKL